MKKFWNEKIHHILAVNANNEADTQRGQLLAIFLLLLCVLILLLTAQNIIEYLNNRSEIYRNYVLQNAVSFVSLVLFWFLNRRGRMLLVAYICLPFVILSACLLMVPIFPNFALLALTLPVLISSFVIKPASSFVFSLGAFITYSLTFVMVKPISEYRPFPALTLFVVAFITWITASQLENALENLRESERKYRNLFNNVPVGLYRTTPDGKILDVNPTLVKMFGFKDQSPLLKTNSKDFYNDPKVRVRWLEQISQNSGSGQLSAELEFKRPDGSSFWAIDSSQAIYDENKNTLFYEGSMLDITERKQTEERISNQLARLAALRAIDTVITGSGDLGLILRTILDQVIARLHVDAANILLFNPHTNSLGYKAGVGFRTKIIEKSNISLAKDSMAARVFRGNKIISIPDLAKEGLYFKRTDLVKEEGFICYFGVPLLVKNQIKGILEVFLRTYEERDWEWLDFLETLANQAAIAIENTTLVSELKRSYRELSDAYETTIEGWSRALDLRDKETEGHTLRVTELTMRIARAMGFNDEDLLNVQRGSLLHDIGKMGIPDRILFKRSTLNPKEVEIIRKHPQFAYDLLSPIKYLHKALDIPFYHHEKWDGTGYPNGLKGEKIPLAARIFAVVDVYDALTSERPYRKPWSKERTLEHIRELEGTHFDPVITELFLSMMKTG